VLQFNSYSLEFAIILNIYCLNTVDNATKFKICVNNVVFIETVTYDNYQGIEPTNICQHIVAGAICKTKYEARGRALYLCIAQALNY